MSHSLVSDIIARYLLDSGIEAVFVYPGGTIAPLIHSMVDRGMRIEVFKHEQGALYAALAVARLTGRVQVAMVTSGPGVTNAITPLADAYYDSTPLLLITGQVGTGDLFSGRKVRQRGFQEVPTSSLVSDICKRGVCPASADEALALLPELLALTSDGRPGPVVFDMPMDVQRMEVADIQLNVLDTNSLANMVLDNDVADIASAALGSSRPVVFLGKGALDSGAFDLYHRLIDRIGALVVSSLPGLGSFEGADERFLGFIGHTGHKVANRAVHEADFLLALGARLDVRQTGTLVDRFVPDGKIAWVNHDPDELQFSRVSVAWKVQADVARFVEHLLDAIPEHVSPKDAAWQQSMVVERLKDSEDAAPIGLGRPISPKIALRTVAKHMQGLKGVVSTGVGSHQQWAARHLTYSPDGWRLLTSAGHGTMGYDLPTSIGAAMVSGGHSVLCVVGDGSLLMNIQELASLAERNLPVKILLLNNNRLGIVSQFQRITWGDDPASGCFATPDFVTIVRGFGIPGDRVEELQELDGAVKRFWETAGPALLEVLIDHDADVIPMLLAGQAMNEMWQGYKG